MTVEMPSAPLPEAVREHDAEWVEYLDKLTAAVEAADPGTSFDWETRERLRISAWVRHVYDHPSSATLFTWPEPRLAAEMRRREIAALAGRLDVGRAVARPARPTCEVWASAAVAAVWEITAPPARKGGPRRVVGRKDRDPPGGRPLHPRLPPRQRVLVTGRPRD